MNCSRCGSLIEDGSSRFCPFCGASQPGPAEPASPADPPASPVLATTELAAGRARCAAHPAAEAAEVCGRCGAFACRDCTSWAPGGQALCAACVARADGTSWSVPWERRAERGLFNAYWETTRGLLFNPVECFRGMAPSTGRWWDPISYALVCGLLGLSGLALFYGLIFGAGAIGALMSDAEEPGLGAAFAGGGALTSLIALISGLGMVPLTVFAWGGLEHLMLRLLGAPTRGFEATVRASCYAHAPLVLGIIPICGYYVFPLWQLVLRILGYRGIHRTTGGKAAAAALVPVGVLFVLGGILYAVTFALMMNLAAHD